MADTSRAKKMLYRAGVLDVNCRLFWIQILCELVHFFCIAKREKTRRVRRVFRVAADQAREDIHTLESTLRGPRPRRKPAAGAVELVGMFEPGGFPVFAALEAVAPGA